MSFRKCFIPRCKNNSKKCPGKIFVRIREDLRKKWCHQANVEYFTVYTQYCCEDHLEPREDLINYPQCKLNKREPKLKRSAMLRNIANDTSIDDESELKKLLLGSTSANKPLKSTYGESMMPSKSNSSKPLKRKYDDITSSTSTSTSKTLKRNCYEVAAMPSTCTCSTLPIKIDAGTQCEIRMVDKSTNYETDTLQSPQETSSTATQSLFVCIKTETEESNMYDASEMVVKTEI